MKKKVFPKVNGPKTVAQMVAIGWFSLLAGTLLGLLIWWIVGSFGTFLILLLGIGIIVGAIAAVATFVAITIWAGAKIGWWNEP